MRRTQSLPTPRPYALYAFWGLHTLMLAFFLSLEAAGFRMPVGSSIFYFTWIAIWLMHGLTLILGRVRQRERMEGDADSAAVRYTGGGWCWRHTARCMWRLVRLFFYGG